MKASSQQTDRLEEAKSSWARPKTRMPCQLLASEVAGPRRRRKTRRKWAASIAFAELADVASDQLAMAKEILSYELS